jgi:hypothetical protein
VQQRLALPSIQLARLLLEEVIEVQVPARLP